MNNTWKTIALATPVLSRRLLHPNNSLINNRLIYRKASRFPRVRPRGTTGFRRHQASLDVKLLPSLYLPCLQRTLYMPFLRCPFNHRVEKNRNEEDVYRIAAGTLAENSRDVPFSALCRVANQQVYVCLAPASPRIIRCNHCFGMGVNLVARLRRRHPGMRECARHFGGDMRIESSHNGTKISFLFPSFGNRPPTRESRLRPQIQQPGVVCPVPASGVVVSG